MHKQLLFDLKEDNGVFRNDETGEILGNTLKLYCYKSDENNIYLDTPKIDYPDKYTIINNDGTEMPLRKKLENEEHYKNFYAIVSKHTKITSIEPFFIEECNSFYSIKIQKEVKELIEAINFENLYVSENLFGKYLLSYVKNSNGYELLFFIHSTNEFYENLIIEQKLKVVKKKIDYFAELYKKNGIHMLKLQGEYSSIVDVKNIFATQVEFYKNNNLHEMQLLKDNDNLIDKYSELLYKRIKELFYTKTNYNKNFLYFGYTDTCIEEEMKKTYGLL